LGEMEYPNMLETTTTYQINKQNSKLQNYKTKTNETTEMENNNKNTQERRVQHQGENIIANKPMEDEDNEKRQPVCKEQQKNTKINETENNNYSDNVMETKLHDSL
jgi:hypothetical protein